MEWRGHSLAHEGLRERFLRPLAHSEPRRGKQGGHAAR